MKTPHTDREITNREENPLLHDTWKLLSKYRDVTWSLELSVQQVKKSFEIEYGTSIDEFLDSIYLAGVELSGTDMEYQAKCIERSNKMLKLVDKLDEIGGRTMYIKRHAEKTVRELSKMFGAVLVAGPRQVGKTTMLAKVTDGMNYATLDDPILRASAEEQSGTFFKHRVLVIACAGRHLVPSIWKNNGVTPAAAHLIRQRSVALSSDRYLAHHIILSVCQCS